MTPVFNGSTSLRDAAGQLIENVTKSVNRKENIDDAYMEKLYSDVTSLYRLNRNTSTAAGKTDLGKLPRTAVILLASLAAAWCLIVLYVLLQTIKSGKIRHNTH